MSVDQKTPDDGLNSSEFEGFDCRSRYTPRLAGVRSASLHCCCCRRPLASQNCSSLMSSDPSMRQPTTHGEIESSYPSAALHLSCGGAVVTCKSKRRGSMKILVPQSMGARMCLVIRIQRGSVQTREKFRMNSCPIERSLFSGRSPNARCKRYIVTGCAK